MSDSAVLNEKADLVGRIMLTHRIDPQLAARALGVERRVVDDLIWFGRLSISFDDEQHDLLALFASILIRLEIRFNHDSAAIRHVLETPLAVLDDQTITDSVARDRSTLRRIRTAIDGIQVPRVRMWRVGH